MTESPIGKPTFLSLGVSQKMLDQLNKLEFIDPTDIQKKAIPPALEGKDVIGIAQTGTGKTLAFAIPMIQSLADGKAKGLVLLPTRELALQVEEAISKVGRYFGLKTAVLIGGASMQRQVIALRRNPNIIIATPGRLIDHLEHKMTRLDDVSVLVLDEADRMLDMGFEPQIKRILETVPTERQTLLFSATMPDKITSIVKKYMRSPVRIEVSPSGTTVQKISQEGYMIPKNDKIRLLARLLKDHEGSMLVFTRTKHGAKKVTNTLRKLEHGAAEIHSNRSLAQRRASLDGFRSGKYRVLVATDIAARGIDVDHIKYVINYDLPEQIDDYVHRIGRTGRAGREGTAISFVQPDQKHRLRMIERLIRKQVSLINLPELPELKHEHSEPVDRPRGSFRGRRPEERRPAGRSPGGRTFGGRTGGRFERGRTSSGRREFGQRFSTDEKPSYQRNESPSRENSRPPSRYQRAESPARGERSEVRRSYGDRRSTEGRSPGGRTYEPRSSRPPSRYGRTETPSRGGARSGERRSYGDRSTGGRSYEPRKETGLTSSRRSPSGRGGSTSRPPSRSGDDSRTSRPTRNGKKKFNPSSKRRVRVYA